MFLLQNNPDTHLSILEERIDKLYKRITGVYAKDHTKKFISQELSKVYQTFPKQSKTPFKIDIYEVIFMVVIEVNYVRSSIL